MTVIIFGGTRGIGRELVLELAKTERRLVVVSRSAHDFQTVMASVGDECDCNIEHYSIDLSDPSAINEGECDK